MPASVSEKDVNAQVDALHAVYERIENLYEAVEHLSLASFRGYAHCQFIGDNPDTAARLGIDQVNRFNIIDQWNILRDGRNGEWYWNPEARGLNARSLPKENKIDPHYFIIRETRRPINEIAFVKYLRQNLSEKDWDAFIEIYGLPGWLIIMPPNIPAGKESEYKTAAQDVAEGGSGALPNGSDAKCADQPRGVNPFKDRLSYLSEKLVLAGTGGLLTMLTAAGSGTLAGSAHMEAFKLIARSDARRISEIFQKQFDKVILSIMFPGKPVLAYFELAAREEKNVGDVVAHASTLSQAGYQMDPAELQERTGYTLSLKPQSPAQVFSPPGPLSNRRAGHSPARRLFNSAPRVSGELIDTGIKTVASAVADDLQPIRSRLETILQVEDPQLRNAALIGLQNDLPAMLLKINANPAAAKALEETLAAALANGLEEGGAK